MEARRRPPGRAGHGAVPPPADTHHGHRERGARDCGQARALPGVGHVDEGDVNDELPRRRERCACPSVRRRHRGQARALPGVEHVDEGDVSNELSRRQGDY